MVNCSEFQILLEIIPNYTEVTGRRGKFGMERFGMLGKFGMFGMFGMFGIFGMLGMFGMLGIFG